MASGFFDPGVTDAPLQEFKSMATHLAPKGKEVENTYQTFRTNPADSGDVSAGALGANCIPHLELHCE
jgi:hypothetical protein